MSAELTKRTKQFAVRVLKLASALPKTPSGKVIGMQIAKSGTSVGANYRSALRGRSKAEFISKLNIALEEADETQYWLELIEEAGLLPKQRLAALAQEATELTAILTSGIRSAKKNA